MIIVSDTSPINNLAAINQLHLLQQLYEIVLFLKQLLATLYGIKAVELIEAEQYDQVVVWREGQVQSVSLKPIIKIIKKCHQENRCAYPVDPNGFMVKTARSLGIYLGEPLEHTPSPEPVAAPEPVLVS